MPRKPEALDPFSVLCRIALLNFKPVATKLGIGDNRLSFSHPTLREWVWRTLKTVLGDGVGNSRDALFNLRKPICRGIAWYGAAAPLVIKHAVLGLRKLLDMYESDGRDNATEALRFVYTIATHYAEAPALLEVDGDDKRADLLNTLREQWTPEELVGVEKQMAILDGGNTSGDTVGTIDDLLRRKEPQLLPLLTQSAV